LGFLCFGDRAFLTVSLRVVLPMSRRNKSPALMRSYGPQTSRDLDQNTGFAPAIQRLESLKTRSERDPTAEEVIEEWSSTKFCDVVNLFLGMILFFSPWLFSISAGAPRHTASIVGLLIAVLSIAALAAFAVWEEWLNLIAGLSLIVAPWLLSFEDSNAVTVDVVIGTIVVALAALEIWFAIDRRQGGPRDGGMAPQR
jgi:SPW repeat-containing protein